MDPFEQMKKIAQEAVEKREAEEEKEKEKIREANHQLAIEILTKFHGIMKNREMHISGMLQTVMVLRSISQAAEASMLEAGEQADFQLAIDEDLVRTYEIKALFFRK